MDRHSADHGTEGYDDARHTGEHVRDELTPDGGRHADHDSGRLEGREHDHGHLGGHGRDHGRGHEHGHPESYPAGGEAYPANSHGEAHQVAKPKGGAGMGIAALVLGVLALLTCWFPFIGLAGCVLGLIAIILGVIAWNRARKINGAGRGLGIAGAILGLISLILGLVITFAVGNWLSDHKNDVDCMKDANGDQTKISQCTDKMKHDAEK